jgi:hypothetical protein
MAFREKNQTNQGFVDLLAGLLTTFLTAVLTAFLATFLAAGFLLAGDAGFLPAPEVIFSKSAKPFSAASAACFAILRPSFKTF